MWGRERTCYQPWFSQSDVGDQTDQTHTEHRKLVKGKVVCGAGKRRREGKVREELFPSSQLQFYSVPAGQVQKTT